MGRVEQEHARAAPRKQIRGPRSGRPRSDNGNVRCHGVSGGADEIGGAW
jgi:hypothetical protein